MTASRDDAPDPFSDALLAARMCAIDPGLGGLVLRGDGELRDAVIAELRATLPAEAPMRRLPVHVDDERLLGGIDLAATLALGRAVTSPGLLEEAAGGLLIVPMADRLSAETAGRIGAAMDSDHAPFLLVALDDGMEPDDRPPATLAERLAFAIDLSAPADAGASLAERWKGSDAGGATMPVRFHQPVLGPSPHVGEDLMTALVATAAALGIESARAPILALRAARASAALAGLAEVTEEDVMLAARLVLAPRATRLPAAAEDAAPEPPPPSTDNDGANEDRGEPGPIEDVVLAAALAALPKDVLARIAAGRSRKPGRANGAGERQASHARGRPMGARAGMPGGGRRLSLIDTLRAAAPWQRLRGAGGGRVAVRRADLRIRRFESRARALTIFAVDASGSSALARLAEAKGAVELLLAESYVKRAEVAVVAFRGTAAELLLPPTRSLARARRSLAELPGGGGTPLAAGLNAAREVAESARVRGRTPFLVVLTDGRANIAADGSAAREAAERDAMTAAGAIGAAGIACAFVDISARPRPEGARLAREMGARYLPLPRADAAAMHAAVTAAQAG
ncbi:magnesium chelatase subunit D [Rhizorhabdus phycosphaerae]|uniref:magnesium chelatase subunit D n=1 Tax=Rhizorhabdus phycosphaerae TaxID=2711156 RepID=UPI001D00F676|nr:magnesium chelatase subunit D [Rhizorhabdus phycosphaerae]